MRLCVLCGRYNEVKAQGLIDETLKKLYEYGRQNNWKFNPAQPFELPVVEAAGEGAGGAAAER